MEGSPWSVAQGTTLRSSGRVGSATSQIWKPLKFPWKTRVPWKARSELMYASPRAESKAGGLGV
jgi:hypothetical protein